MSKIPGPLWLPWVSGIVVIGLVGGGLGLAGVFGHPTSTRAVVATSTALTRAAVAYACPGGPAIDNLDAGDKVLALQRSDDSAYLGVRDPLNLGREVWLRTGDVTVNPKQDAIASLPIGSCPEVSVALVEPAPVIVVPVAPPVTKPAVPDTTAPTVGVPTAQYAIVCNASGSAPYTDVITTTASDNVGVVSVAISWSGATTGGPLPMTHSGSVWTYTYNDSTSIAHGTVTFQVQARDAAGNLSASAKVNVTQGACVG